MSAERARSHGPWGNADRRRAGFVIWKHGMSSWPMPRPESLWFGASPSGLSGSPVDSWADPIGGRTISASGTNRPAASTVNGLPAADFDGSNDQLQVSAGAALASTSGELWQVAEFDSLPAGTHHTLAVKANGNPVPYLWFMLVPASSYGAGSGIKLGVFYSPGPGTGLTRGVIGSTQLATGTRYVVRFTGDGSDWAIYLNGAAETLTVYQPGNGGNTGEWFGAVPDTSSVTIFGRSHLPSEPLNGKIAFQMLLPGLLSSSGAAQWTGLLRRAFAA